jgi:glycosyltransferase involved in cell wall biosynthesis
MNTPLVSLALIAGPAEGEILFRLIQSAKGLWDEVIVVAATGSQQHDDLRKALQDAAGEAGTFAVYHNAPENSGWPHIDNFAAARNQAFSLAQGKYVIWADCDDLFLGNQAALHRGVIEERDKQAEGWDVLVTRYDVQNSGMRDNRRERVFRRKADGTLPAHWERAIHERVKPDEKAAVGLADGLCITHVPKTNKTGSGDRNKRILASETEGAGMNWYYIAMEDFLRGQYQKAIGPCLLALEHPDVGATERYQLLCMAGVMCAAPDKKRKYFGQAITLHPTRKEAHGHLACQLMDEGNLHEASRLLQVVDSLPRPAGVIWNLDAKWYGHLPKMLLSQCLRAAGQKEDADRCEREAFRAAWGKITVIYAGELAHCVRAHKLFMDTSDNPAGIQHLFITPPSEDPGAKRFNIVKDATEAIEKALGHILLTVKAEAETPIPPLMWDAALIHDGTLPGTAQRLPDPVDKKSRVVIGLTTTPKRIHTILPTIESLLAQSMPADEIILSVPEKLARTGERFPEIPAELQKLADEGRITIYRSRDHGPATKFVGAAWAADEAGAQDDFVIWCDDDILYSPRMVQTLVENCPDKAALGLCGFFMTGPKGYAIAPDHLGHAEIIEGFGAIACRLKDMWPLIEGGEFPSCTPKEFAQLDDKGRARFMADDFVMSYRLRELGTKTLVCATPDFNRSNGIRIRPEGLGEDALQNNKGTGGNLAAYSLLKS